MPTKTKLPPAAKKLWLDILKKNRGASKEARARMLDVVMRNADDIQRQEDEKEARAAKQRTVEGVVTQTGSESVARAVLGHDFEFAVGLRSGEKIRYRSARVMGADWLHLDGAVLLGPVEVPCECGMDVRLSEIVWARHAPKA